MSVSGTEYFVSGNGNVSSIAGRLVSCRAGIVYSGVSVVTVADEQFAAPPEQTPPCLLVGAMARQVPGYTRGPGNWP